MSGSRDDSGLNDIYGPIVPMQGMQELITKLKYLGYTTGL
jgi:hypothetical protein